MCTVDMLDLQFPPPSPYLRKLGNQTITQDQGWGEAGVTFSSIHPLGLLMINSLARNERFKNLRKLGAEQID